MKPWYASLLQKIGLAGFIPLIGHLRPYRRGITLSIASGTFHHLLAIAAPALGAYLAALAVTGGSREQILPYLPVLVLLVLGRIGMYFADMWFAHEVAFKILVDFRIKIYQALDRVAPAYLLKKRSGELSATLMADVEVLEWFFAHTAGAFLVALIVPLLTLGLLFRLHWLLGLVLLPFVLLLFTIPFWFKKAADKQGAQTRRQLAEVHAEAIDGVQGLREIISFNFAQGYLKRLKNCSSALYACQLAYGKRMGVEGALTNLFVSLALVLILGLAGLLTVRGDLNSSWLPVAVILAVNIFTPIVEVVAMGRNFSIITAAGKRVAEVLEAQETVVDQAAGRAADSGSAVPGKDGKLDIAFEEVSFRYDQGLPYVLEDVSIRIEPGQTVALVGPSGVGKTTCMNLLQRFWDVERGRITIAGKDVREMPLEGLRSLITVVPQEIYLFNMSIRDNIRLGKPDAGDQEVEDAARAAHIHEFILSLPEGYDTNAGERGLKMSGGQKQRLAIARAILRNAPLLIMDEALSSLDTENERLLQQSLRNLRQGKTTLIVAHRLSTFREADKLVVLNEGKVVETGRHAELVRQHGYYYQLITAQIAAGSQPGAHSIADSQTYADVLPIASHH